jgi:putative transposase
MFGTRRAKKGHLMAIDTNLIDQLLAQHGHRPEDIVGETGLLKQLTKALLERVMQAEMTHHLGYEKHDPVGYKSGNSRNGNSRKKLSGEFGEVQLETPRDRNGSFDPKIVAKHQTRFTGFDEKIVSMYSRGMSTRDIEAHLKDMYGVDVSAALVSQVTEAVQEDVRAWQSRPLDGTYPIVYLDALYVKMRDNGQVQNRAVYVAIGVNMEGVKNVLGLWTSANEGAKFWLQVLTEIRNRGVKDIFIACVDGLKGFPEAIETMYPKALVQLCIVHMVRHTLNYVSWKQRREVAADLRTIYTAPTATAAELALEQFAAKWDKSHATLSQIWQRNWERIIPFFQFPEEIRKVIYTTNAVESLNMSLRKIIKTRGSFPNEEAAIKLLFLGLRNHSKKWNGIQGWREALNRFQILWPDRMPPMERQ